MRGKLPFKTEFDRILAYKPTKEGKQQCADSLVLIPLTSRIVVPSSSAGFAE
jgi:hypothetical protein